MNPSVLANPIFIRCISQAVNPVKMTRPTTEKILVCIPTWNIIMISCVMINVNNPTIQIVPRFVKSFFVVIPTIARLANKMAVIIKAIKISPEEYIKEIGVNVIPNVTAYAMNSTFNFAGLADFIEAVNQIAIPTCTIIKIHGDTPVKTTYQSPVMMLTNDVKAVTSKPAAIHKNVLVMALFKLIEFDAS